MDKSIRIEGVKIRIYPNKEQEQRIRKSIFLATHLYNDLLNYINSFYEIQNARKKRNYYYKSLLEKKDNPIKDIWEIEKEIPSFLKLPYESLHYFSTFDINKLVNEYKSIFPEYKEEHYSIYENVSERLSQAFDKYFQNLKDKNIWKRKREKFSNRIKDLLRRKQFIKAKELIRKGMQIRLPFRKVDGNTITFRGKKTDKSIDIIGNNLKLPKFGLIKFRDSKDFSRILCFKRATLSIENGQYFASLIYEIEIEEPKYKHTGNMIGLDVGLLYFAILSNGEKIENPKYFKKYDDRLNFLQRRLSRKHVKNKENEIKHSKRYEKTKIQIGKIKKKITTLRKNFHISIVNDLVSRFDLIAIEDLKIRNMVKHPKLARHIQESGWYQFRMILQHKAELNNKEVIAVAPNYTSKCCSVCGNIFDDMDLSVRKFTCLKCNTEHDRDINASVNILNKALKNRRSVGDSTLDI